MCYSGKCKYESYDGECGDLYKTGIPNDALCVIHELEILRLQMAEAKNDFRYLVAEAIYKDEIMEQLKSDPESMNYLKEDFELALYLRLSNIINSQESDEFEDFELYQRGAHHGE